MNSHLYAALIGALVFAVFLALVLWEVRQYALAKKGVGQPCKHGKPKGKCLQCRRRFSLFSLFSRNEPDAESPQTEQEPGGESDDSTAAPEGDNHPKTDPTDSSGDANKDSGGPDKASVVMPAKRFRLRDLGVRIGVHDTGPFNAITDVAGVRVGHTTLNWGEGALVPGTGPVCTGVTAIIPREDMWKDRVTAGCFVANGNGIVTGLDRIKQSGSFEGPILLTNTLNVYSVADAAVSWMISRYPAIGTTEDTYIAIVGECDDSSLSDIQGRHVKDEHVFAALNGATSGPVQEGAVGGGTGMICYDFKGGIGTSSRRLGAEDGGYTVGVLVNCNHGDRHQLRVDGVPVGKLIPEDTATQHQEGSIVIVVATDAPLNAVQLEQLSLRAVLGLARTGAVAQTGSGDFVLAFSTGRIIEGAEDKPVKLLPELSVDALNPVFEAVGEATEEAVLNALCMAETVVGRDGNVAPALPLDRLAEILRRHGRLN